MSFSSAATLKAQGKAFAEVEAAHPTAAPDAKWGRSVIDGQRVTAPSTAGYERLSNFVQAPALRSVRMRRVIWQGRLLGGVA